MAKTIGLVFPAPKHEEVTVEKTEVVATEEEPQKENKRSRNKANKQGH